MNPPPLLFSKADNQHAEQLVRLINSAFRGEISRQGWTTEADLLDGRRTDYAEILLLLADIDSMILVCTDRTALVGSVHLHKQGNQAHIGMLAVSPPLQGTGIGKQLLQFAEQKAIQDWAIERFVMTVISVRCELMAFYERLGYQRTGIRQPFPINPALWTPKVTDLKLELLEKMV